MLHPVFTQITSVPSLVYKALKIFFRARKKILSNFHRHCQELQAVQKRADRQLQVSGDVKSDPAQHPDLI